MMRFEVRRKQSEYKDEETSGDLSKLSNRNEIIATAFAGVNCEIRVILFKWRKKKKRMGMSAF